jgi:hypothetical protein
MKLRFSVLATFDKCGERRSGSRSLSTKNNVWGRRLHGFPARPDPTRPDPTRPDPTRPDRKLPQAHLRQ